MVKKYFGQQIKERREQLGWSQHQFGNMLNLTRVSILNIESGRHGTTMDTIYLMCQILKCTPNDLFPPIKKGEVIARTRTIMVKKKIVELKFKP